MKHVIVIDDLAMGRFKGYCKHRQVNPQHVASRALDYAIKGDFLKPKPEPKVAKTVSMVEPKEEEGAI